MKVNTKWKQTLCPKHKKYLWGEWHNTCLSYCHGSQKLVCINCEGEVSGNGFDGFDCNSCKRNIFKHV